MIDSTEIVISSQSELDKLLDDNYNALYKVAVIDKNIRLDSSIKTNWELGFVAFFKHDVECRNIDAGLLGIETLVESNSKITAHHITADRINCTNIQAHHIDCKYLKARAVSVHSTTARRIHSNRLYINNMSISVWEYNLLADYNAKVTQPRKNKIKSMMLKFQAGLLGIEV